MNPIIESLYYRKSVRAYEDRYTILDITEQNLKDALAENCDHQPFIAKAPMVLVISPER